VISGVTSDDTGSTVFQCYCQSWVAIVVCTVLSPPPRSVADEI
jgi:hypothetical protein